jgi:hypothetical protein
MVRDETAIRPFHVNGPEAELADLRKRILATRLPEPKFLSEEMHAGFQSLRA